MLSRTGGRQRCVHGGQVTPTQDRGVCALGLNWGASVAERRVPLPCNELLPDARTRCDRAISVDAPAAVLFRWLCQLRVAPYSYDLLDNLGRRSPR